MKRLIALIFLVVCSNATAGIEFTMDWTLVGLGKGGLEAGGVDFNLLETDMEITERVVSLNGQIYSTTNTRWPVSGTCIVYGALADNIYCEAKYSSYTLTLDFDIESFGGIAEVFTNDGQSIDTSFLVLKDLSLDI